MAIPTFAQKNYNEYVKYSFFSNLSIGGSVQYSRSVFSNNAHNWGADLRLTKKLGKHWRLRGIIDVNGFAANGFDRYGKAMLGASLDFLPFYIFTDYGLNVNPSAGADKFGLASDAGIGFNFDIGRGLYLHTEVGLDCVNNGSLWRSNGFIKFGYSYCFGPTESDRERESLEKNQPLIIAQLTEENQSLRNQVKKDNETLTKYEQTLERINDNLNDMENRLNLCSKQLSEKTNNSPYPNNVIAVIRFDYASSTLTSIEDDRVADAAEIIAEDNYFYTIEGWSSNNGDPYTNEVLSKNRAKSVLNALVEYGIDENRMVAVGRGCSEIDDSREQKVLIIREIR